MIEIPQEIKKVCKNIGLDRAQTQVYYLLVQKGLLTIQNIAKEISLPRSSVHLACEDLLAKGVIKVTLNGKRRNFYVENPNDIKNFISYEENKINERKNSLAVILPKFSSIFSISQDIETIDIENFQGEQGFVEIFMKSLNQPKFGEILRFGGDPKYFNVAKAELRKYRELRMKKKIFTRMLQIRSETSGEEIKDGKLKMRDVRILEKEVYDPNVQVSTWQEYTAMTIWDKGLHSIVIRNKRIAQFMRQMFEIAWNIASKK